MNNIGYINFFDKTDTELACIALENMKKDINSNEHKFMQKYEDEYTLYSANLCEDDILKYLFNINVKDIFSTRNLLDIRFVALRILDQIQEIWFLDGCSSRNYIIFDNTEREMTYKEDFGFMKIQRNILDIMGLEKISDIYSYGGREAYKRFVIKEANNYFDFQNEIIDYGKKYLFSADNDLIDSLLKSIENDDIYLMLIFENQKIKDIYEDIL